MTDDRYLWDGEGPVDPEVDRLERLLRRFGHRRARPRRGLVVAATLVAAAATIVLAFVLREGRGRAARPAGWSVAWLAGPAGKPVLAEGEELSTGANGRVRIEVADIGHVELDPHSSVRLVSSRGAGHRLDLEHGRLHAWVVAPPRLFVVGTRAAKAVDLGCAYTLDVDEAGRGTLEVVAGEVLLEADARPTSFVPQGATCRMRPGQGPGVPWLRGAPASLEDVDPTDPGAVEAALVAARPADALTLWHLIERVPNAVRERVVTRLAAFLPPADRDAVLALDPDALQAWRRTLSGLR